MPKIVLQTDVELEAQNRARNAQIILGVLVAAALPAGIYFAYLGYHYKQWQFYAVPALVVFNLIIAAWLRSLARKGRVAQAMGLLIALYLTDIMSLLFIIGNAGMIVAVSAFVIPAVIAVSTLTQQHKSAGIFSGIITGALALWLDSVLGGNRFEIPQVQAYTPYIISGIFVLLFIVILQEFRNFSLRVKVAFGILATGTIVVLTLTAFALNRSNSLIVSVSDKFEASILEQVKADVSKTVEKETQNADALFGTTLKNLQALAEYRVKLETRKDIFSDGAYWNAAERITQLRGGQYGNSAADEMSIFIPNTRIPDEAMFADLNTTAYLDFAALGFLEANPRVVAVYYISASGAVAYYPNINLAEQLPAGFDPVSQPFYTIANPTNNPERLPRWTAPYQDPAGTGLIVTLSIPIYANGLFKGVLGADLQLAQITDAISKLKLGQSGFAFLVDREGHVLAMPPYGYPFLGLQPEEVAVNESPKRSVLETNRSAELTQTLQSMINGESGLVEIEINGAPHYVGFAPLESIEYRVAVIAAKDEMATAIYESRRMVESETRATAQDTATLLLILFAVAGGISFIVGQVITNPLVRLTKTVEQIANGNISARAVVETLDETGRLAASVNTMNDELKSILANLEERIRERTREIEETNATNERRAAQFEAVARVARTISTTQTMDTLLPQIVETISKQFNFYHVGIFLVDSRYEYAILVAANSEGGQRMLARNHRLPVGESGIVGYVTSVGQPRVALDVGTDATYFNNPDLPDTHSEIALPLRIGAETFGALDVQSTEPNAFSQEDINILSTLADQVSVAIQNARSYQQSREALAQAEKISFQLSGQQWKKFIERQEINGYYFDGTDIQTLSATEENREHHISVPLMLRGARIGAIRINALDPQHEWSDDELAMMQAVADRAALALENARLLEESQKRAVKERTISEISAKIGGLTDIESIIQTAIMELGATLPGTNIAVQFTDEIKSA